MNRSEYQFTCVAFIGPNGAGKSTTLKLLAGILQPDSGDVRVLGLVPSRQRTALAFEIGTVFGQRSQLWYQLPPLDTFKLLGRPEADVHLRRPDAPADDVPGVHAEGGGRRLMTRLGDTLGFTRALVATNIRASLALRGAFAMQALFMVLNNLTFFVFWWVLMQRTPSLRGWRLADVQVLFGVVAAGYGLTVTLAGGVRYLGQAIEEGVLDTLLVHPKPVLLHALGLRLQPSGVGDLLSGLLFIAFSGQASWRMVPVVALAIVASAVVIVASGIVFFGLAFWIGRVDTAARQLWELLLTFSLYPEPLFGGALRVALFTVLPAGFVGYLPAKIVRAPSMPDIALLVVAAPMYLAFAIYVFHAGLRRYASASRFTTFG